MSNLDKYRTELDNLVEEGASIFSDLNKNKDESPKFNNEYQQWYTRASEVIRQVLPVRHGEFVDLYEGQKRTKISIETYTIKDWLLGIRSNTDTFSGQKLFEDFSAAAMRFKSQVAILAAAKARFTSSLFDIKQIVQADLFDSELDAATNLNKNGFQRGAGAIAGVVIEGHLLKVCENHQIQVAKKDPGINDIAGILKENGILDIPEWRKIQHLADVRNLCDHKKRIDPTEQQIDELIEGARKITKTLF